jgi:hypothetical protein
MGKDDRRQIFDWEGKFQVLVGAFLSLALKHSAVECHGATIYMQQVTGPGNLTGRANKGYFQTVILLLRRRVERELSDAVRPGT